MEIYSLYQAIQNCMLLTDDMLIIITSIALTAGLLVSLFILQGVGIYAMATKQGVKNRALAFIPFLNIWYIGKLAGDCHFFGQRIKRAGMYAMIAQILVVVMSILMIASEQYLWLTYGAPQVTADYGYYYWTGLTGFAAHVSRFYDISSYVLPIFQLLVEIFLVIVMMGLFKKYVPNNYRLFGMLVFFVPLSRCIIIFVLSKRQPIDYEAYMRARHEAFMRAQQQYYNQQNHGNPYGKPYGNPYGNPYARPNSTYGNSYGENRSGAKPDDPFGEFTSENKGDGNSDPFADVGGHSDDLFN